MQATTHLRSSVKSEHRFKVHESILSGRNNTQLRIKRRKKAASKSRASKHVRFGGRHVMIGQSFDSKVSFSQKIKCLGVDKGWNLFWIGRSPQLSECIYTEFIYFWIIFPYNTV